MNQLVRDFYRSKEKTESSFHEALFLTDHFDGWEKICQKTDKVPRGWIELCCLSKEDRIEFVRDFWLNLLPYHPTFHLFLNDFFEKLDDLGIVMTQSKKDAPWNVEMVYSLADHRSFFRGLPPCSESDLDDLKNVLTLPHDYLSFLRIHNGFGKLSELGLLQAKQIIDAKQRLMEQFIDSDRTLRMGHRIIDPGSLIPFFEFYGLASYQCFFNEWYPGNEMGNVYLSGIDYTISDTRDRKEWVEQMAFPTFLDWLTFYLAGNPVDKG